MSKILNILLQRNDPRYPWGFNIVGTSGALYIDKVSEGALSSQHLTVGDKILQIAGIDSEKLDLWQAQDMVQQPSKSLELIVLKNAGLPTSRKFSDCSESVSSTSSTNPWQSRCRIGSPASVDARKAKQQFWERCNTLQSRDFHGSVESDLFRTRGRHSRSGSLERGGSATPHSFSSTSDIYRTSALSEPIWTYKNDRNNFACNWDRSQSFTEDTSKFFSEKEEEKKETIKTNLDRGFSSTRSNIEDHLSDNFKEFFINKPGKFPWQDSENDNLSNSNSKREEFTKLNRSEYMSSISEHTESYSKKTETKSYELEENLSKCKDSTTRKIIKENEEAYSYQKSGFEENVSVQEEKSRSHTPAGFYENHREEIKKEERSFIDSRGKSVEKEEVVSRSYARESSTNENQENNGCSTSTKEDIHSASSSSDPKTNLSNATSYIETDLSRDSSPDKISVKSLNVLDKIVPDVKTEFTNNNNIQNDTFQFTSSYEDNSTPLQNDAFNNLSNKDKRNIFDARKYWSCTSPTPERTFIFSPQRKLSEGYAQQNEHRESRNGSPTIGKVDSVWEEIKEPIRRQQSQISGGNSVLSTPSSPAGIPNYDSPSNAAPSVPPPPPPLPTGTVGVPPPPPPIGLVHIPAIRLRSEIPDVRREPPAAIQNAMMKDKKPFTYTPGGLDLSEIRSPRMQRRISRNAQTTDDAQQNAPVQHQQPRPVSLPPSAAAAMQPQIAVPVFPQGNAGFINNSYNHAPTPHPPPPPPPIDLYANNFQPPPPPPQPMAVPKTQPQRQQPQHNQNTGSIYVPPVQQSLPRSQLGSLYIPPVHNQQQDSPPPPAVPTTPAPQLNKAPTPWLSRQSQQQKEVPPWVNKENSSPSPVANSPIQNFQHVSSPQQLGSPQSQTRIIPIQVEGREPVQQPNTRVIPIKIEGMPSPQQNISQPNFQQQQYPQPYQQNQQQNQQQQQQQQRWPVYVHNKYNPPSPSSPIENTITNGRVQQQQPSQQNWGNPTDGCVSPAPVQSRSFKVLQKITDTDPIEGGSDQVDGQYNSQGVPLSQLRKLQLSDDDRALMNKVRNQVDEDNFLHTEAEPRYRGAAIPSRAFRMLQNMTDNPGSMAGHVPYGPTDNQARPVNRRPQQEPPSPTQPYVHPSEQQVQEPRMYTGAAIPSRSFRMLQAMTGPDPSGRPDESDY